MTESLPILPIDNCIPFDHSIADIYDGTRPFLGTGEQSPLFTVICQTLLDKFKDTETIRVLDVGAGTGRIALVIAQHYQRLLQSYGKSTPQLEIVCVDRSNDMLEHLTKKTDAISYAAVKVLPVHQDVRQLTSAAIGQFQAGYAHWFCHVVRDWALALYAVDKLLVENGLVFLFEESSSLYRAIDDNLSDFQDKVLLREFWNRYHEHVRRIMNDPSEAGVPSPRCRLGGFVVDDSVKRLWRALGWSKPHALGPKASWRRDFTIDEIIENVIRRRAFTNMRLFHNDVSAQSKFAHIADSLRFEFRDSLPTTVPCEVHFKASFLERDNHFPLHMATLLLDTVYATLGESWRRRIDRTYWRPSLWGRLFAATWQRLNQGPSGTSPFGGVGIEGSSAIVGVAAMIPTILEETHDIVSCSGAASEHSAWSDSQQWWGRVTQEMEIREPSVFWFCNSNEKRHQADEAIEAPWYANGRIHPTLHIITIPLQLRNALAACLASDPGTRPTDDQVRDSCLRLARTKSGSRFIQQAVDHGVIPSQDILQHTEFLSGVARLCMDRDLHGIYFFPFPVLPKRDKQPVFGMAIGVSEPLREGMVKFVLVLGELLFGKYVDELTANGANAQHAAQERPAEAVSDIRQRALSVPNPKTRPSSAGLVIVTSTSVEADALVERAGIVRQYRDRIFNVNGFPFVDLGFSEAPIWWATTGKGTTGPSGSALSVYDAIKAARPWGIVMAGIAYGLKKDRQRIGDILLSDRVFCYEAQRVGEAETRDRGDRVSAFWQLLAWFQTYGRDWQWKLPREARPSVHEGLVISGDKLVDDPGFRAELIKMAKNEAIGGEMEGAGLVSAAAREPSRWIVVKAICDWGMGKGDQYQVLAAKNAMDYVFYVLEHEEVLRSVADVILKSKQ